MSMTGITAMLPVRDLGAAVAFYGLLGFDVERAVDEWGWAMLRSGDCRLMLDRSIHPHGTAAKTGVLYLYRDDVAAFHATLRARGIDAPAPSPTFYGMLEFRLDDPDGNRLWIGEPLEAADPGDAAAGADRLPADARAVLDFWFREIAPARWFAADPDFDATIRARFEAVVDRARRGELSAWRQTPHGRLAEVIVLDQFTRNLFRGSAEAFAADPMALALAQEAVAAGALAALSPDERAFLLMPYMHSESPAVHVDAERLFRAHAPAGNLDFELRHKAIVDRFGRYPHRNAVLGRASTPEETAFLATPGSSF